MCWLHNMHIKVGLAFHHNSERYLKTAQTLSWRLVVSNIKGVRIFAIIGNAPKSQGYPCKMRKCAKMRLQFAFRDSSFLSLLALRKHNSTRAVLWLWSVTDVKAAFELFYNFSKHFQRFLSPHPGNNGTCFSGTCRPYKDRSGGGPK